MPSPESGSAAGGGAALQGAADPLPQPQGALAQFHQPGMAGIVRQLVRPEQKLLLVMVQAGMLGAAVEQDPAGGIGRGMVQHREVERVHRAGLELLGVGLGLLDDADAVHLECAQVGGQHAVHESPPPFAAFEGCFAAHLLPPGLRLRRIAPRGHLGAAALVVAPDLGQIDLAEALQAGTHIGQGTNFAAFQGTADLVALFLGQGRQAESVQLVARQRHHGQEPVGLAGVGHRMAVAQPAPAPGRPRRPAVEGLVHKGRLAVETADFLPPHAVVLV